MKLSMKTDYALRVLSSLVEHYGKGPVSIRELAKANDAPKRFLEHILLEMKKKGWVDSTAGKYGGYVLAKPPDRITMGQVVRHFTGLIAPMGCVSASQHEECSQEANCRFRRVFLDIRNYTAQLMDQATLAEVFLGAPVKKEEVFDEVLMGGAGI